MYRKNEKTRVVLVAAEIDSPRLPGVLAYAKQKGNWKLIGNTENCQAALSVIQKSGEVCDGILAFIPTPADAKAVRASGLPAVNLSARLANLEFPRVCPDDYAIGKLAAEHLLEKTYRRLAVYWCGEFVFAQRRRDGFVDAINKSGRSVAEFRCKSTALEAGTLEYRDLIRWLKRLKSPVGLFADCDQRARAMIQACHEAELSVPDDVAIIGVDNLETLCELCDPPLTSIRRQDYEAGYRAAELLDKMMDGQPVAGGTEILLPPVEVVERGSTDMLGIDSKKIANATKYIKEHISERFKIEDMVSELNVSRRWLQRGFNQWLGMTPLQYINQMRVERVKELLASPEKIKLKDITEMCGFRDQTRLGLVFKRVTGMSIKEYKNSLK